MITKPAIQRASVAKGVKVKESEVAQSCPTLWNPVVCSQPGSSIHGILHRQEYWSEFPFPSPGDLPDPGIEPRFPAFRADALTSEPPGKIIVIQKGVVSFHVKRCLKGVVCRIIKFYPGGDFGIMCPPAGEEHLEQPGQDW